MKVLVLTTSFPRWQGDSTAPFVYDLCRYLRKKGFEIVVLAPGSHGAKQAEKVGDVQVYRFRYFFPSRLQKLAYGSGMLPNLRNSYLARIQAPFLVLSELLHALLLIKRQDIDLIHAHWSIPSGFIAGICKKVYRKSLIITVHAADVFIAQNKVLRFFSRLALNWCDTCTVNSPATLSAVARLGDFDAKARVIPMGIDTALFRPRKISKMIVSRKKKTVVAVGRLVEKKGFGYLIQALPIILKRLDNVRIVIVGEGPEKRQLVNLAHQLGVIKHVRFVGAAAPQDLPNIYSTADVMVLPSIIDSQGDTEGLGVVLLEAMACGIPVVGSRVGGIPYIIQNGVSGFLTEPKKPGDLAEKILRILENADLQSQFSQKALEIVRQRFSLEGIAHEFGLLYMNLDRPRPSNLRKQLFP